MGSCVSTDINSSLAGTPPTAKVITLTGAVRECPSHLTAADVLASDSAYCFLCNSDKLFCDDYIPPLDPEELLRPGQLYFVLPVARLRYPLSGSDMKELVLKASSALALAWEKGSQTKGKKEKRVKILPVLLEVDGRQQDGGGGGGDMDEVGKLDGKVNHLVRRPSTVHSKMKRCTSVRGRVGFCYRSSFRTRLSTIMEVAEWIN